MGNNNAGISLPRVRGFALIIGADGRVKVDDWNRLTADEQRLIAEYVVANYQQRTD